MNGKPKEECVESQSKLNLSEIYTNEEIKLLKQTIPEINNKIISISTNDTNTPINNKNISGMQFMAQPKEHYFSSNRKTKNNSNISILIDKEKFYILILDSIRHILDQNKNHILSKAVSLIMDDFLHISKITKQNLIYNQFFNFIKNSKILNYNQIKENNFKNEKASFHSNLKNITDIKYNNRFNKSNNDLNLMKKEKDKINYSIKKGALKDISVNKQFPSQNLTKIKINMASNKFKRSDKDFNNYSNFCKQLNTNNLFLCPSKISLKKSFKNNKKIGVSDVANNLNEINLTGTMQNLKKDNKEKCLSKNLTKSEKIKTIKYLTPAEINPNLYKDIETQEFNIFNVAKVINRDNILPFIGGYIYKVYELSELIKSNKFEKWTQKISEGYVRKNYYHNELHAADVTQTCLVYLKRGDIDKFTPLAKPDILAVLFSCMCHDYKHPGVNNNFLKETNNRIALNYNDESILENMHISETFKLIFSNAECNIFDGVEKNTYKQIRKEMISCVLATDMAYHHVYVDISKTFIKERKENAGEDKKIEDAKKIEEKNQKTMNLLIHSADISNPTKLFDIYFQWAKFVVEEFWDQGDKEKKLNLPCFCDREKVTIYQSQLGFINFIEIPYFSLFAELFQKLQFVYDNLLDNKNRLLSMQEKEKEKEKEKENGKKKKSE